MAGSPKSVAESSGDMLPLELEEFEDVSLLMDNPLHPAKQTYWQKAKSIFRGGSPFGRSRGGFSKLVTEEELEESHGPRWCPEEDAGFLSTAFFYYVNSLMALGYQKHLEADDLWTLCRRDKAQVVVDTFQRLMESTMKPVTSPQGSVLGAMWRVHRAKFSLAGVIKFVHDILQLSSPLILRRLLGHLEREDSVQKESAWIGVLLALTLLSVQVLQTVLVNLYFHIVMRISIHLKAQLVQMIYRKSLRITSAVKSGKGVGAIVNLQSNDASKLWSLPSYLHIIWSGPFQILSIMAMLVKVLGWLPAFAGLLVTILIIPMNAFIGKYLAQYRKLQMGHTDARVKLITEVIMGIKAIKLYAWEDAYVEKITQLRTAELQQIKRTGLLSAFNRIFFTSSSILIALAGFGVYTATGGVVTASVVFPALALFQMLRFPVMMFPNQITNLINGRVALKRIQSYMESDEMDQEPPSQAVNPSSGRSAVSVKQASFSWTSDGNPVLSSINMDVKAGELVIVVGEVGQGKSSLLAGLLGELNKLSGDVKLAGSVAYTAQEPWIQNASVQKNILMSSRMVEDLYAEVISACALVDDLEFMAAGDLTEIGEKGINLSGGQKHRVALARACYSKADVYLLDDPLSAVDAHVGRHIFENCVMGILKNSTRILVTHQLQYLSSADRIILLKDGKIAENGTYAQLKEKGVKFDEFKLKKSNSEQAETAEDSTGQTHQDTIPAKDTTGLRKHENVKAVLKKMAMTGKSNLTKPEERSVGNVKRSIYAAYIKNWGPGFVIPVLLGCTKLSESGLVAMQNWWLSVWSHGHNATGFYMTVYFMFGLTSIVFTLFSALLLIYGLLNASRKMHSKLLKKVVRMPMSFFDTQPSGRLINRFSKDTEALDSEVAPVVSMAIGCFVSVLVSVLVVIGVAWTVFVLLLLLGAFYYRIQQRYLATTRELKRLDSLARSPIFSQFSETLAGLQTIRASRLQKYFFLKNEELIDLSNRAQWPLVSANRWLSIHLEIMSSSVVFFTALMVAVFMKQRAGLAGLAMTSALNFTGLMNWMIRQVTQLEVSMNCVERLVDYNSLESEKAAIVEGNRTPSGWPMKGAILATNVWIRYRPDLDPVLKGLTFKIKPQEKIGVCGRTGCGKSTLMMSMFRIMELEAGSILIDGVDISKIGLQDLRRNLCLVPQDPVIFCGSVRMNLDPFDSIREDSKIWEALRQAHMSDFVQSLEGGLDAPIAEGGGNLSCGQKQLLCMARALLRGSRILVLDEATSNVDNATDSIIQETIRTAFKEFTVLTIAHRLHTILDYDRVMVLDNGELQEFDSPKNLLSRPSSMFSKLVQKSARQDQSGQ